VKKIYVEKLVVDVNIFGTKYAALSAAYIHIFRGSLIQTSPSFYSVVVADY